MASQFVDGFQIPAMFSAEAFRSALKYKPRDDDIFIVTYPKCGTTWAQHILALIFKQGEPLGEDWNFLSASPFLELLGAESAETMARPGAIKVHLPFHLTPWSDKAKYVYVTRNPKDTCVSYFHHMTANPAHGFTGTFDEFFEIFLSGKIDYEDYFDNLLGWYEHRNDSNVLFVTYEEMKENPHQAILKIASFLDDEKYADPLRQDSQKLENIVKHSSFKEMKASLNVKMDKLFNMSSEEAKNAGLPESLVDLVSKMESHRLSGESPPKPSNFVRKGIVGDWRNYFSEDQSRRMDEKFAERTKGTEIENYWKEYM
ncbi:hypothetical protein JTE90_028309 [Oedothorax gibbosus]|uniref:Sulfotransferase domain-containing protein n=1 Tax=Oedothorax gibbosus TaxID=931172 RepID=A0AAV6U1B3_9ARAC|nr:hypothetical protein JTE90_028309 [Oedothorax gibbosus]